MKTTRIYRFLLIALIGVFSIVLSSCGTTRAHVEHDFGYNWDSGQYYNPGHHNKPHKAPKPPKHKKNKHKKNKHKHCHHGNHGHHYDD
ncbi:MAG: hypothetical protein K2M31_09015 [Muribaculaceae bacterium]|nr:hypothetical protein [Muribaculaceae bacterium]